MPPYRQRSGANPAPRPGAPARRPFWRAALAAGAAALLAACTSPTPEPVRPSPAAPPNIIGVMSFNVCGGQCAPTLPTTQWASTVAAIIDENRSEVVMLQEICRSQYLALSDLLGKRDPAVGTPYTFAWKPSLTNNAACKVWGEAPNRAETGYFGNAILIRGAGAIRYRTDVALPNPYGHEPRFMICLDTAFEQTIRVCNVHIDYHPESRKVQLAHVAKLVGGWAATRPVVLGGDLNIRPDASELQALYSAPLGTGRLTEVDDTDKRFFGGGCTGATVRCRTGETTMRETSDTKVSYIFASDTHFKIMDGGVGRGYAPLSSHLPLFGLLAVTPPASAPPSAASGSP